MTIAFPGYVSDVGTGGTIGIDWGNAIRDRALQVFTDSTARDAAITVPKVGQMCYLTTAGSLLIYAGATVGWRQPWNMPWGRIGSANITANSAAFTVVADIAGLSVTFTALANRRYYYEFNGNVQTTVANDQIRLTIADGASANLGQIDAFPAQASGRVPVCFGYEQSTLAAGSATAKMRGTRVAGTGSCVIIGSATFLATIVVYDVGPNGNPS